MSSPVKHATILSGSFGEPRTQHFHAGIDYKQYRGIPRDTIFAVGDGQISKISVQPDGYGNVLYIKHLCNKTTVYAHLYKFSPKIQAYIDSIMIQRQVYSIEWDLDTLPISVFKGEPIGIMGSTGRSSGPHLHFEIRNSSNDTPHNPAIYSFKPKDDKKPVIVGIMIYGLSPDGGEMEKCYYPVILNNTGDYSIPDMITSSHLKLGIGVHTYDQMNGASNHNGIYSLEMTVDGKRHFGFQLDSIAFAKSKYIHTHMDYESKLNKQYVTKCFLNPGNDLGLAWTNSSEGVIYPFEFKSNKVMITVSDFEGNTSNVQLHVKRSDVPMQNCQSDNWIVSNQVRINSEDSLTLTFGLSQLDIKPNTFATPVRLKLPDSSGSFLNLEQPHPIAVFRLFKLSHKLPSVIYPQYKYCFTSVKDDGTEVRYRSKWEGPDRIVTFVNELTDYYISIDTVSPAINIIKLPSKSNPRCEIEITDNFDAPQRSEQLEFEIFVDDEWQLCQHDIKSNLIWFHYPVKQREGKHQLLIRAVDRSRNATEVSTFFGN